MHVGTWRRRGTLHWQRGDPKFRGDRGGRARPEVGGAREVRSRGRRAGGSAGRVRCPGRRSGFRTMMLRRSRQKYHYANSKCLGGMLVWAASLDDRRGSAQRALCQSLGCTVYTRGDVSGAPKSCGSTGLCERWHTVVQGDTCYGLYSGAGISMDRLRALNPQLKGDCSNLRLGEQYCVQGMPGSNNTASCTPSAPGIGGPSSTLSGIGYNSTGTVGTVPGYGSGESGRPATTLTDGAVCYVGSSVVPVYPTAGMGREL